MADYWLASGGRPPISNLVMLAPANFGSPLAHRGRSLIGRVVKGFKSDKPFQTGTHVLKALEMSSPYTWNLAQKDRFAPNAFSDGGVSCTVIVGNRGYDGISSIANENGSDGTVYLATANLNCWKLDVNFCEGVERAIAGPPEPARGPAAFVVLEDENHTTVAFKNPRSADHLDWVIGALDVRPRSFRRWRETCSRHTESVMASNANRRNRHKHGFQNTVFRVRDDLGNDVADYVVELYENAGNPRDRVAQVFNRDIIGATHAYQDNSAYRSFMFDCSRLTKSIGKIQRQLRIRVSALPNVDERSNVVGYRTFDEPDIGALTIEPSSVPEFFSQNRTLFVDICLTRIQKPALFEISPAG